MAMLHSLYVSYSSYFKITPRFAVSLFVIGRECFHACGGYPYTWMREDTLYMYLLPENQSLNSRCKFVVKMVYSSNIFKIAGIIFLHEE